MTTAANMVGYWFYQVSSLLEVDEETSSMSLRSGARSGGFSDLKAGDFVFVWVPGVKSGLKGWGIVSEVPASRLKLQLSLKAPIPSAELASSPGLSDAPLVIRSQTGTYFRLSAEQAFGLSDFLRSRNLVAPEIAVDQVLEPITRRVERELVTLRNLLPDIGSAEAVQRLGAQAANAEEKLHSGGVLGAYQDLKALLDALGPLLEPSATKSSSHAPLDAARSQLSNDLLQIARFAEAAPSVQVAKAIASQPGSPQPPPKPVSVKIPPVPAATLTPPTISAKPSPSLPKPKDPLFQYWEQTDLIGIGPAVNNLSRYISHEGLVPPVAIGVFGDWGSGKSFFIRALQSQIALLSSQSRDALRDGRTTVFCSHIVQIEFNAWHFVESNLWASLAAHIFERLYAELERRSREEGGNGNVDALYQQFSAYKQAVAERERLDKLVDVLTSKREELERKRRLKETTVTDRLSKLGEVLRDQLKTLSTEQLNPEERAHLDALLRSTNLEELAAARAEAAAIVKEGRTFLGRMRAQLTWWGGWQLATFVVMIAAAVFGLPRLVPLVLGARANDLERMATLLGGYAVAATTALTWLARSGRTLIAGAQKVERVLAETRARVENAPDAELLAAKRDIAEAQSEIGLVDQQIADQRKRLAELADDVDPNQLGTRLQAFLEAKVKSDAYQKHLGLISLVRRDFSSLYELMLQYWDKRKQPVPQVLTEVRDALGEVVLDVKQQVPFIERIVLYIDDLDRCPEDKVVEVMQAVHLMLGLPLFVVVVAVDVRWVSQSIRKHYGRLVGWDEEIGMTRGTSQSASADDYLEKIFQIPYRIHPMEPDVRKTLLGGLLRQPYLSGRLRDDGPGIVTQQELVPKELSLYPQELEAIEQLYQSVGSSPRRVRRLLDVYRLMRAGMEEGDAQELISRRYFAVILALFALLSGAPVTAPRLIELLRQETLRNDDDPAGQAFANQTMVDWAMSVLRDDAVPAEEAEVMFYAMSYVDGLGFSRSDLLVVLRKWIPEIARYSFREVRMYRL